MTKKVEIPVIKIKQRKGAKGIMVGGNTEVYLDGKKMNNVTNLELSINAVGVAKIRLEMVGKFEFEGKPILETVIKEYKNDKR